jgi:hypothetical protein
MTRFHSNRDDSDYQLDLILNGGIDFADNIRGGLFEITIDSTSEQTLVHDLGFVPSGFIVILTTSEITLWASRLEDWTQDRLFFQSSATSQTVRLFVM